MVSVTVYSTGPSCIRCTMTCRCLQSAGIPFHVIDVTTEPIALQFVTEELGYTEAPVVIVDGEPQHHWAGFRPDLIVRLAERIGASHSSQIAPHSGLGLGLG
jgi:glutaredoxin-like protein NrdH